MNACSVKKTVIYLFVFKSYEDKSAQIRQLFVNSNFEVNKELSKRANTHTHKHTSLKP